MYSRDTEIRLLPSNVIYNLALHLEGSWLKLMRIIPKEPFSNLPTDIKNYKYSTTDQNVLAKHPKERLGAEILLDEWGTTGKKRPTLGVLLELLVRAQLFRAADHVAMELLGEPAPARPNDGPAAKIDISFLDSQFNQNVEEMLDNGDYPGTQTLNDNAKPSRLADNNIDYYEKYTPNDKRLTISVQSNGIPGPSGVGKNVETRSQNQNSSVSVTASQEVIPKLSELCASTSAQSDSNNCSNSFEQPSGDIPNLSALNTQPSLSDIIPNLSALHVHNKAHLDNDDKSNLKLPLDDLSPSTQSSSSTSTISSSPDDDDDNDSSAPNLSILGQQSSNNDSSLTNVTATSEDNSFDISLNEESTSYDNIPHLSILK